MRLYAAIIRCSFFTLADIYITFIYKYRPTYIYLTVNYLQFRLIIRQSTWNNYIYKYVYTYELIWVSRSPSPSVQCKPTVGCRISIRFSLCFYLGLDYLIGFIKLKTNIYSYINKCIPTTSTKKNFTTQVQLAEQFDKNIA